MNRTLDWLLVAGAVLAGESAWAQTGPPPPINDNFANRIVLSGASVDFQGTALGATREPSEPIGSFFYGTSHGSVWWSWTSPITGFAVVTHPAGRVRPPVPAEGTVLSVLRAEAGAPFGFAIAYLDLQSGTHTFFDATAGTTYYLQLAGDRYTNFVESFHLEVNAAQAFLAHPQSQTVRAGDSLLLTSLAPGSKSGNMQWQFNGVDLPNQTSPVLILTNVTAQSAGDFRVLAHRFYAAGTVTATSQVAHLTVEGMDIRPTVGLQRRADANFPLALAVVGETNQSYVIQQSGDVDFMHFMGLGNGRYRMKGMTELLVGPADLIRPWEAPGGVFFKVFREGDLTQNCIANLRAIAYAKARWAEDRKISEGNVAVDHEVDEYLPNLNAPFSARPVCREGGTYYYNIMGVIPTCTIAGHTL